MSLIRIVISFSVTFLCLLNGLAFAVTWANVYDLPIVGASARSIQPTSDGGFIVIGNTWNGSNDDVWAMKLTSTGNVSWQKRYGGSGQESARLVIPTSDGGYVFTAATESYGAGDRDGWIVKLTSTGTIQWQITYGGIRYEEIFAIQQTADGGFVFAGYTDSFGDPVNGDGWVAKINSSGGTVWQKSFGSSNTFELIYSIQEISGGRFICAGRRDDEAWVMMLTPIGNIKWQKSYGGSGNDEAYGVQWTSDGSIVVAGLTDSFGAGGGDFWMLKLNSSGTILWQKTYGGPATEAMRRMDYTSDGGTILTGWTLSFGPAMTNVWAVKLDSAGGITWQKTYGGGSSDTSWDIQQTSDGGYILAGVSSSFGATGSNPWVLKLESNGDIGFSCPIINSSSGTAANSSALVTILSATSVSIPVKTNYTSAVPVNISSTIVPLC